jgi:hypothetical protein
MLGRLHLLNEDSLAQRRLDLDQLPYFLKVGEVLLLVVLGAPGVFEAVYAKLDLH